MPLASIFPRHAITVMFVLACAITRDMSEIPTNTFRPKEPYIGTVESVHSLVQPGAPGEVRSMLAMKSVSSTSRPCVRPLARWFTERDDAEMSTILTRWRARE